MEFVIAVVAALPRKGEQRWLQRRLQDSEVFFFFFCHQRLPEKEQQLSLLDQVITSHRTAEFSEKNEVKKREEETGAGDLQSEILRHRGRLCHRRAPLPLPGKAIVEERSREAAAATWGRRPGHGSIAGRVRSGT